MVGNAHTAFVSACQDEAVGLRECHNPGFLQSHFPHPLLVGMSQMFAHGHLVVAVAEFEHTRCDGGWVVLLVGEHAYLLLSLNQHAVELMPRASGERDDIHVVVGHHEPMGQQLEGVEGRIGQDLGLRQLPSSRVGESEEERVAGCEHHDFIVLAVLLKHLRQWRRDVDPHSICGQQSFHQFVVPPPAAEHLSSEHRPHLFGVELWLWRVCQAYNCQFHKFQTSKPPSGWLNFKFQTSNFKFQFSCKRIKSQARLSYVERSRESCQ